MILKSFFVEHRIHVLPCMEFQATLRIPNKRTPTSLDLYAYEKASVSAFQSSLGHLSAHCDAEITNL